jgi:hypothetical protein
MKITKNELLLYNKKIRNCQFCRINAQCYTKKSFSERFRSHGLIDTLLKIKKIFNKLFIDAIYVLPGHYLHFKYFYRGN